MGKMPGSIKKGGMGLLLDAVQAGYQRLVKTAVPDMPAQQAANLLQSFYGAHLPLPKLIALAKPDGGELDKSDIHENLGMSSLRSYDAHTAYGLCTDFRRQAPQTLLTFQRADGQRMTVHPQWIPDEDNNPNNQIFVDISTPPDAPVALHEQFVIRPDGTHECTAFNMHRDQAE